MDHDQEQVVRNSLEPFYRQEDAKEAILEDIHKHRRWPTEWVRFGLAYRYGRGVLKDTLEAYKWFKLAAEHGDRDALEELARLTATLSSDELDEGDRRYRELKASN
jgi:hypothetical protein